MIFSFLAGAGLVVLVSLTSAYGLLQILLGPPEMAGGWYVGPGWLFIGGPENPTFGRNHITQSAFLAFGAMLALGQAWVSWRSRHGTSKTFFWVAGSTLYVHTIFLLQGRTGYLLVAVFTLFWLYVALRYLELKKALLAIVLGASLVSALGISSPHLFSRTHVMVKSVSDYAERGEMTDSGVRLEFWRAGLEIMESRPAWGVGLGGFAEAYSRLEESPEWLRKNRSQPHSEFVLIATQSGLTGLLILVGLWFYLAYASVKITNINPSLAGLTALYFVDAIFNSVIWDLAEGHFLVLLIVCSCVFAGLHGYPTSSSEPKR
jgi:O-antigen ligase